MTIRYNFIIVVVLIEPIKTVTMYITNRFWNG